MTNQFLTVVKKITWAYPHSHQDYVLTYVLALDFKDLILEGFFKKTLIVSSIYLYGSVLLVWTFTYVMTHSQKPSLQLLLWILIKNIHSFEITVFLLEIHLPFFAFFIPTVFWNGDCKTNLSIRWNLFYYDCIFIANDGNCKLVHFGQSILS